MAKGRTSEYAKIKIKTIKNRNIDQLIDCNFNIPGIPKIAVIKEVGVGKAFHDIYKQKYGL